MTLDLIAAGNARIISGVADMRANMAALHAAIQRLDATVDVLVAEVRAMHDPIDRLR